MLLTAAITTTAGLLSTFSQALVASQLSSGYLRTILVLVIVIPKLVVNILSLSWIRDPPKICTLMHLFLQGPLWRFFMETFAPLENGQKTLSLLHHVQTSVQDFTFIVLTVGGIIFVDLKQFLSPQYIALIVSNVISMTSSNALSVVANSQAKMSHHILSVCTMFCLMLANTVTYSMVAHLNFLWIIAVHCGRVILFPMLAYCMMKVSIKDHKASDVISLHWILWSVTQVYCIVPMPWKKAARGEVIAFYAVSTVANTSAVILWVHNGLEFVYAIVVLALLVLALIFAILKRGDVIETPQNATTPKSVEMNSSEIEDPETIIISNMDNFDAISTILAQEQSNQNDSGIISNSTRTSTQSEFRSQEIEIDHTFIRDSFNRGLTRSISDINVYSIFTRATSTSTSSSDDYATDISSDYTTSASSATSDGVVIYDLLGCRTWPRFHSLSSKNVSNFAQGVTCIGDTEVSKWLQNCGPRATTFHTERKTQL